MKPITPPPNHHSNNTTSNNDDIDRHNPLPTGGTSLFWCGHRPQWGGRLSVTPVQRGSASMRLDDDDVHAF